jgi:hypothetical protein
MWLLYSLRCLYRYALIVVAIWRDPILIFAFYMHKCLLNPLEIIIKVLVDPAIQRRLEIYVTYAK